jgi:hypothetical protein
MYMQRNEELREAYRTTWRVYAQKLDALQTLVDSGRKDVNSIEAAVLDLERARLAHNSARDHLAEQLFGELGPRLVPRGESPHAESPRSESEERIRNAAHLLWELAGRPQGTAERDWTRAQALVRSAASASVG